MQAVMTDSAGKLFVGFSSKESFSTGDDKRSETSPVNADLGIDKALVFASHQHMPPVLTEDQVVEIMKRIGDLEDMSIRKLLAQMEGQRWMLPPDPKTELSYRFFALAQILDLLHTEEKK